MLVDILYAFINITLLLGIAFLLFRKTIIGIFKNRRDRINSQLDRVENQITDPAETANADSGVCDAEKFSPPTDIRMAELLKTAEEEKRMMNDIQRQHLNAIRAEMLENTRAEAVDLLFNAVAERMRGEEFAAKFRRREKEIAQKILKKIRLTDGDKSYMLKHQVLYVTLTSAFPLDDEIITMIDDATEALLSASGGKKSYWVRTDKKLIGGLTLRIGDTVYDGSLEDVLYSFRSSFAKKHISHNFDSRQLIDSIYGEISRIEPKIDVYQLGRVIKISDGICWLDGLADIMYGEVVEFDCGERGMILDIQPDKIGCVVFGNYEEIESGNRVRRLDKMAGVPVGEQLLGRVVDALGRPIDGLGKPHTTEYRDIEAAAPAIPDRAPVNKPLFTGIKAIDSMIPIGKGQRELIIGDRQTGKSSIAIDAILNQRGKNVICIYAAIGQKDIYVADLYSKLKKYGAMEYTIIVSADAFSSASMQYIAPFAATSMGEYFMYSGKDVLIIYDDLSKHAVAYRELSLLLQRPSGREAYPGDVFYLHARLLERSAHLSDARGGGSMTALPIIETQSGDISAYIPTNTISITDGQIFLESDLFNQGQIPAINVGLSVSRVGSAAQTKLMKQVSAHLRTDLAQYRELQSFSQFGSDLDDMTKSTLARGERMMASLRQPRYSTMDDARQALIIFAVSEGYADNISPSDIEKYQNDLIAYMDKKHADLMHTLSLGAKMQPEFKDRLCRALAEFTEV